MAQEKDSPDTIGRFYTSARFFKQVLGSLPDGTKIPGGPYTYTQISTMLGIVVGGWILRGLWTTGSGFGDILLLLAVAVGAGYLIAQLPQSRRTPLKLFGSAVTLLTHPGPGGRWKGKPLRLSVKAQKIQREAKKNAESNDPDHGEGDTSNTAAGNTSGLGYGSSLHRLIQTNGEREN
jgi:hypothetical protein